MPHLSLTPRNTHPIDPKSQMKARYVDTSLHWMSFGQIPKTKYREISSYSISRSERLNQATSPIICPPEYRPVLFCSAAVDQTLIFLVRLRKLEVNRGRSAASFRHQRPFSARICCLKRRRPALSSKSPHSFPSVSSWWRCLPRSTSKSRGPRR